MIYRVQPKNNFTCIANQLLTTQLKPSAKLVLIDLLSKHPDFKITISAICNDLGVGRDYVRSAFDALQKAGYLQCHKCRRANGTYDTVYDVFSHPDLAKQNLSVMPLSQESDRHKPLKQHPCRSTRVGFSDAVNPTPNNTTKKQNLSSHYLSQYQKEKEQTDRTELTVHTSHVHSEPPITPMHLQDMDDLEHWKSYIAQTTVSSPVKQAVSTLQESDLADIQVMMQQWESSTPDAMLRILTEVAAVHHLEAMPNNLADFISWDTLEFRYQVRYRIACKREQKNIWDAALTVIRTATKAQSPAYRLSGQLVSKAQLSDKLSTLSADEIYAIVSTCSEQGQAVKNWSGYILAALYNGIQQDTMTKKITASSQETDRRMIGGTGSNRSASGQRRNRFHNFDQREYDYDAWKQELLAPYRQAEPAEIPDFSDMLSKYRAVAGD